MKVFDIAVKNPRPQNPDEPFETIWYDVDPDKMYPSMVQYVLSCILDSSKCAKHESLYVNQSKSIGDHAFEFVLFDDLSSLSEKDHTLRDTALEICRKWFTTILKRSHIDDIRVGIHIKSNKKYKMNSIPR